MSLNRLDHVNLRTARLETMTRFYADVLDLRPGERPPFPFPGAWLYCDGLPVVHLIGVQTAARAEDPAIEHFAFSAAGLADFLQHLRSMRVPYRIGTIPGFGTIQVNIHDPDGNRIHVDFGSDEAPALEADASMGVKSG